MSVSRLADCEYYTEGPAIDEAGNIYFTTLTGGKILKIGVDGSQSVWAQSACPNGQKILLNGDHLVCDSRLGSVIRFDELGVKIGEVVSGLCGDTVIKAPNDLVVDEDSGFYFTDSIRVHGAVYFVGNNGTRNVLAAGLDYPNGICLSRNKSMLYIAESYKNRILVVQLKEPGVASGFPEVFCELPINNENPVTGNLPDGIIVDRDDRLWVAHYGMQSIRVISRDGQLEASFDSGIPLTSNLCFKSDAREVLVTGGRGEPGPGNLHLLSVSI